MLYELNKTLECITPFLYHLDPIVVESPLVVLCLADRTLIKVIINLCIYVIGVE
jgi:hypothetical protein